MAKVLICTGKRKKVQGVLDHFRKLNQAKKLAILAHKLTTKRMLVWSYEELKILFEPHGKDDEDFGLPKDIGRGLDLFSTKDQALIRVDFESFQVEDNMLKVKILTIGQNFLRRQVRMRVKDEVTKHSEYRIDHKCVCQISGPVKDALSLKDILVKEKLCNPKSVKYFF